MRMRSLAAVGLAGLSLIAAGCGSDDDNGNSTSTPAASAPAGSTSTAATPPAGKKIKVGLVTDIGGLNDRSFNSLANKGLEDAKSQLGIDGRVLTSKSASDYIPNLSTLAQQKYDLIIGVGFLMAEAVDKVATKYPNVKFAIIDSAQADMKGKPANVEGLLFSEQQGGYLAGYLAGLYAKDNKITTVSSIGGQNIPPVFHYMAGYEAGAKAADPSIKTLHAFSGDFVDQSKCKELALSQIQKGSGVVFAAAGQCGLGALDAAKQQKKLGVGVDADQGYLGTHILTSATKKVDVAVLDTIKETQQDQFKAGTDTVFDLKVGGVGIGKISAAGTKYQAQIDKAAADIKAGTITVPDTLSK